MCDICDAGGDLCDLGIISDIICADCDGDDPDTGLDLCFSEVATVQVLQADKMEMTVSMKDLKVGDRVLTGRNVYQEVYAFAHRLATKQSRFYQIHNENSKLPLEVTADHLVFLGNQEQPVAAVTVQIGDVLRSAAGPSKVTKISSVKRTGIYAPLTTGGSLVVDGVQASSYIRFSTKEDGALSDHSLIHMSLSPYRMLCSGVSARFCDTDNNGEDGMPHYVRYGLNLLHWVSDSGIAVQFVAWPAIVAVSGSFWLLELLFGASMAPLMVLLAAVAYSAQKKTKAKAKSL